MPLTPRVRIGHSAAADHCNGHAVLLASWGHHSTRQGRPPMTHFTRDHYRKSTPTWLRRTRVCYGWCTNTDTELYIRAMH
jgi:hypothetical protein